MLNQLHTQVEIAENDERYQSALLRAAAVDYAHGISDRYTGPLEVAAAIERYAKAVRNTVHARNARDAFACIS